MLDPPRPTPASSNGSTEKDLELLKDLIKAGEVKNSPENRVLKAAFLLFNRSAEAAGKRAAESKFLELSGTQYAIEKEKRIGDHGTSIAKHEGRIKALETSSSRANWSVLILALIACGLGGFGIYSGHLNQSATAKLSRSIPLFKQQSERLGDQGEALKRRTTELEEELPKLILAAQTANTRIPALEQRINEMVPMQLSVMSNDLLSAKNDVVRLSGQITGSYLDLTNRVLQYRTHYFDIFRKHALARSNDLMVVHYLSANLAAVSAENDSLKAKNSALRKEMVGRLEDLETQILDLRRLITENKNGS